MFENGTKTNPFRISHNSVASALEKASCWQLALSMLMALGSHSDLITFSAAISACENAQKWNQAMALLNELQIQRLEANLIVYNAVLSACEKASQWQQVLFLFREVTEKLVANVVTYTAVISACERSKHWQHALDFFHHMKVKTVKPNAITCASTLEAIAPVQGDPGCEIRQSLLRELSSILESLLKQRKKGPSEESRKT